MVEGQWQDYHEHQDLNNDSFNRYSGSRMQGCKRFLISLFKSVKEEYQVVESGRGYQGCGKEYNVGKKSRSKNGCGEEHPVVGNFIRPCKDVICTVHLLVLNDKIQNSHLEH